MTEETLKGKLIVLEGIDGAGKGTQTTLLQARLAAELDSNVVTIDFPQYYDNVFGKIIGNYLKGDYGDASEIDPYVSAQLYAGDRFESKNLIKEHIENGDVVILNRYVPSNKAYNMAKLETQKEKDEFIEYVDKLEYHTNGLPRPDAVIFLDTPIDISQELIEKKEKREYMTGEEPSSTFENESVNDELEEHDSDGDKGDKGENMPSLDLDLNEETETIPNEIEIVESDEERQKDDVEAILDEILPPPPSLSELAVVKDNYERNIDFQNTVREMYLELCSKYEGWIQISCMLSGELMNPEDISNVVFKRLTSYLEHKKEKTRKELMPKIVVQKTQKVQKDIPKNSKSYNKKTQMLSNLRAGPRIASVALGFGRNNISLRQQQQLEEAKRQKERREMLRQLNLEKKEKKKQEAAERKQKLLNKVNEVKKTRREVIKETKTPTNDIKTNVLPLEIIERTRKTDDLLGLIFGSPEYTKDIYYFFLQKYGYNELPSQIKFYFRALMKHYFDDNIVFYQEDEIIKSHLSKVHSDKNQDVWQGKLNLLYKQYKIAIRTINATQRRWFPEEILILASIFRYRIKFGEKEFLPVKLDSTRLASIYVRANLLRTKYLSVAKFLHANAPIKSTIQINL